jgi:hypothetical protein
MLLLNGVPDRFYEHVVRKLDDKAAQNGLQRQGGLRL